MQTIQLTLTLAEVNQILDALGQKPYIEVCQLIGKMQQQAEAQLQANEVSQPNRPAERRSE